MKRGASSDQIQSEQENNVMRVIFKLYKYMFDKIEAAKIRAMKSHKPLLILFGENHHSEYSYIADMVAISAAIEFGFKRFCLELDDSRYDYFAEIVNTYLNKANKYDEYSDLDQANVKSNHLNFKTLFFKQIAIKPHLIDQGADGDGKLKDYKNHTAPLSTPTKKPGIQYRNTIMADELIQYPEDTFAIVGASHLYGLAVEESTLADHFEILELKAATPLPFQLKMNLDSYHKRCTDYRELDEQFYDLFLIDETLFKKLVHDASFYNPLRDQFTNLCQHWLTANQKIKSTTPNMPSQLLHFNDSDDNRSYKKMKH